MQGCLRETHFLVLRVPGLSESEVSRPRFIHGPSLTLSPDLCIVLRGKEPSRFPKG